MQVYLDFSAFTAEFSLQTGGVLSCHSIALYLWTFSLLGYNKLHYNWNKASNKLQKLTFVCISAGVIGQAGCFYNHKSQPEGWERVFLFVSTAYTVADYKKHSIITYDLIISVSLAA